MLSNTPYIALITSLLISGLGGLWLTLINQKRRRWIKRHQQKSTASSATIHIKPNWQTASNLLGYTVALSPAGWFIAQLDWSNFLMWFAGVFILGWVLVELLSTKFDAE